ncbi:hypothetical protein CF15_03305 [Pyrodictium occultum]|uniref:Transcription factor NikR nickel binding C-terminal domain-containing protein n=1 Tax=Pyrodictium occultum TaxID=2309 RepID=A0A0V8RV40_PYROC|nr:hypothetical protein CF15_03305 [Pyrodictium occultum]
MVVKTGVALPDHVYQQLLEVSRNMGYTSVSRAIRDAVELFIAFNRWWSHRGRVSGTLQLLAPKSNEALASSLQRLLSEYSDVVHSATLIIASPGYILYIIAVRGEGGRVKSLYKHLARLRGVLSIQAALLPSPEGGGASLAQPREDLRGERP